MGAASFLEVVLQISHNEEKHEETEAQRSFKIENIDVKIAAMDPALLADYFAKTIRKHIGDKGKNSCLVNMTSSFVELYCDKRYFLYLDLFSISFVGGR